MDRDLNMHNQLSEIQRTAILANGEIAGRSRYVEGEPFWVIRTITTPQGTLYYACLNDSEAVWKVTEEHASEFIEVAGSEMASYLSTLTHTSIAHMSSGSEGEWSREHEAVYAALIKSKIVEMASDSSGQLFNQSMMRWQNKSMLLQGRPVPIAEVFNQFDQLSTPEQLDFLLLVTKLSAKY